MNETDVMVTSKGVTRGFILMDSALISINIIVICLRFIMNIMTATVKS